MKNQNKLTKGRKFFVKYLLVMLMTGIISPLASTNQTVYAETILPTWDEANESIVLDITNQNELQAAINSAGDNIPTTLVIKNDIVTTSMITIPDNKIIRFKSNGESAFKIDGNGGHYSILKIESLATLWLENIIITGSENSETSGNNSAGGVYSLGYFVMSTNSIIRENKGSWGGGVAINSGTFIMMKNSIVENNIAQHDYPNTAAHGGGVMVSSPTAKFIMTDNAHIRNNSSDYGGGLHVGLGADAYMLGNSIISENQATDSRYAALGNSEGYGGGGVLVFGSVGLGGGVVDSASFYMSENAKIVNNESAIDGGGISIAFTGASNNVIVEDNAEISANTAQRYGGGIMIGGPYASLSMKNGTIFSNTANSLGGGICSVGIVNMSGGIISENKAPRAGGLYNSNTFNMSGGTISKHSVKYYGGGIYNQATTNILGNASITDNESYGYGGGIYNTSILNISGESSITNNIVDYDGGGIYNTTTGSTDISQSATLSENYAKGNGGAIYAQTLDQLTITGPNVTFSKNVASYPSVIEETNIPVYESNIINMEGNWTSPFTQGFNNFDINQTGEEIKFEVFYDANGGKGNHVDSDLSYNSEYSTLGIEDTQISRNGYHFIDWNTKKDNTGISYNAGDKIIISDNIFLYAVWEANTYHVKFDANGGSGFMETMTISYETNTSLPINTFKREGYSFLGWSKNPEATTVQYIDGSDYTQESIGDVTLYAIWKKTDDHSEPNIPSKKPILPQKTTALPSKVATEPVVNTGDSTNIFLFLVLITISGAILLTTSKKTNKL